MPKIPEFLEPKDQKPDRRVEIEWHTISYRTVTIIGVLLVLAAAVILSGISILSFPFTRKPMPLTLSCQSQIARASLRW